MSQTETTQEPKSGASPIAAFTDTLVDMSLSWAEAGIGFSKTALENSARALERTAKHLEGWQERIRATSQRAAAKEATESPAAEEAPKA